MLRLKSLLAAALCSWGIGFGVWSVAVPMALAGQAAGAEVVARAGGHELTRQMLEMGVMYQEVLAGADFSGADADAMRRALIAEFQENPGAEKQGYDRAATVMQRAVQGKESWFNLAVIRYRNWSNWVSDEKFRQFQAFRGSGIVLKYNPVVARAKDVIVSKHDVDSRFINETFVARAAGVPPPTDAQKAAFTSTLATRLGGMSADEKYQLASAELRAANISMIYNGNGGNNRGRAAMIDYIRQNVRSSDDVSRVTLEVERQSEYNGKFYNLYMSDQMHILSNAIRVNGQIAGMGQTVRSTLRQGQIGAPAGCVKTSSSAC
jgi:hypothetical protein